MVQIQYISDLHVDHWDIGTPFEMFVTPVAPILVIAGDICSAWLPIYAHFLSWCSRNWFLVIFITGNHEYHNTLGRTMDETDNHISVLARRLRNTIFLQNGQSYVVPNTKIRFVGATLWAAIDPAIWVESGEKKGDFKNMYVATQFAKRTATPSDTTALHALHKAYIASAILPKISGEQLIVVTHHMPSLQLLEPRFRGERWHTCYANADDDLFIPNVRAWICGHSHRATKWTAPSGTLCLMNARGYNKPHEQEREEDIYNPRAIFTIPISH